MPIRLCYKPTNNHMFFKGIYINAEIFAAGGCVRAAFLYKQGLDFCSILHYIHYMLSW